jgi:uncharacterized membrane protein YuzA (DUF378 family)
MSLWRLAAMEDLMLRVGYGLLMLGGAGLVGFAAYHVIRALLLVEAIPLSLRIIILVVGAGVILTLAGLVWERRKEARDAADDNSVD